MSGARHSLWLASALLLAAAAVLLLGAGVGSTGFESVLNARTDPVAWQILWDIRLPRTLGAWVAGGLLGLAGAVAQGLFRNPLADPYLLGSASGAALGVALALALFGTSPFATQWLVRLGLTGAAFAGAVIGVVLTLTLARGVQHTLRLLLAGVIVGVVLGAGRDLVAIASPDTLQAMQGFMLGSTGFVGWAACGVMAGMLLVAVVVAASLGRVLDGLALGEATALSLGLPLGAVRGVLVAVLALATGAAVAQTGLIAFVGLAAPHLVRSIVKTTHARLLVLSALMGGLLLMAADVLARWIIAPQELPVGVLTAVLGGSYLLWLMHRRRRPGGFL
ncbi:MAG: iron ABC transporter permease [Hydrogenophaga sp.]|uniref:FecCD family ABC transporter permease n=1 Tax=Hydrogenophaga sp. TaxID=1904254 RepID=UPI0025C3FB43|nr:iron ABC transporter permease [Hydrogenophaga sp.]MDO9135482.1 iron ABC transporter permease [Hydrogenophaga sp.]MDO9507208.1 iron ABC transporter permease [Hydrogenophaga sp.]MDP1781210.1 iron ABC transporter permease [Hydrogenophaga sp.]MDP2076184.1 iron ABC transporter permease [Hydrogenophaga sp.]MDP2250829.1 iron ABC transporter permease [Hydrogenophaga sp.]